jgi:hypothetical protein
MTTRTLPAHCAALLLAVPAAAAADLSGPDDALGDDNPCKPYPERPAEAQKAYCTVRGVVNVLAAYGDEVLAGNGTVGGLRQAARDVVQCVFSNGAPPCPQLPAEFTGLS